MRRKTNAVKIGNIELSSEKPVMIQSMLNIPTMKTEDCVEQSIRIIKAGGELVRITAPGVQEAKNLRNIRELLHQKGYDTPISADIHFTPDAALIAAQYVEKVRINPGNFVDKRAVFQHIDYTEEEYAAELSVLRQKFIEFLEVCRAHGTAVRIGTNHGSLSDRIMSRYGDTPAGMVESTMEYLRVCKEVDFNDVVISLKSSDCRVMVDAVRLLVREMDKEGMHYPLHLGVTEAGEGEDGRIRSAIGIGTLLNEGIGDTIRVSLTEAPEAEIPVAQMLVDLCDNPQYEDGVPELKGNCLHPFLIADLSNVEVYDEKISHELDFSIEKVNDPVLGTRLQAGIKSPEVVYTETLGPELTKLPENICIMVPYRLLDMAHVYNRKAVPLCTVEEYLNGLDLPGEMSVYLQINNVEDLRGELADKLKVDANTVLVFALGANYSLYREAYRFLQKAGLKTRTFVHLVLNGTVNEKMSLKAAAQVGGLFLDRLPEGLWISTPQVEGISYALDLARNILQSAGVRRYKAEFVSCPGCGRTRYDLQGAVAKVKAAFADMSSLKIAVMGCVVNGPGEMGDADYGYVGAGNGKVNLYRGHNRVRVGIPEDEAVEALRQLIESDRHKS